MEYVFFFPCQNSLAKQSCLSLSIGVIRAYSRGNNGENIQGDMGNAAVITEL
jgi:hypothetical protein